MASRWVDLGQGPFPPRTGVYVIYSGDSLLYVGKASNLQRRLGQHVRGERGRPIPLNYRVKVRYCKGHHMGGIEEPLIHRLQPPMNVLGKRTPSKRTAGTKQLNVEIPVTLHSAIQAHCQRYGISNVEFVSRASVALLESAFRHDAKFQPKPDPTQLSTPWTFDLPALM